jgi:hypothetical protein
MRCYDAALKLAFLGVCFQVHDFAQLMLVHRSNAPRLLVFVVLGELGPMPYLVFRI